METTCILHTVLHIVLEKVYTSQWLLSRQTRFFVKHRKTTRFAGTRPILIAILFVDYQRTFDTRHMWTPRHSLFLGIRRCCRTATSRSNRRA